MTDYTRTTWIDDDGSGGVGTALNATRLNKIESGIAAASATRVSTPPGSPVNNQVCYLQTAAMATLGITWTLMYSSASGKWEAIGNTPGLYAEVLTDEPVSTTSYVAIATAGPIITLPLAGDFIVEIGARMGFSSTATYLMMSYDIGATAAVDADYVVGGGNWNGYASLSRSRVKTGLSAVTLTAKYKGIAPYGTFANRYMKVTPIRVG